MISGLKEIDPTLRHAINQPVLLGDAPRPAARQYIPERLWFADSCERISEHCLYEFEDSERGLTVRPDPIAQVFPEFGLKYSLSLTGFQDPTLAAICRSNPAFPVEKLARSISAAARRS
jgi:hypothetical protein